MKPSKLGQEGEKQAFHFLKKSGYDILASNLRNKVGELDIIAKKEGFLCIIEVKTRRGTHSPIEAVTLQKRQKIFKTTRYFQIQHQLTELPVRFDILGIVGTPEKFVFELIEDAFSESDSEER